MSHHRLSSLFRETEAHGASHASPNPNAESAALLRKFATERSQVAFAEFVQRHIDLVYSAAMRRCGGDAHRAEDVVQRVFTAAAREAKSLCRHPAICAWLHTATRNVAINAVVSEQRRLQRERTAAMTIQDTPDVPTADWAEIRDVLDRALDELAEADRVAVLLRYFEKKSYAEMGAALNVSENSARMRTDRALEKLRLRLAARGITSTAAALGSTLTSRAVAAAPSYLTAVIAGVVLRDVIGTNALVVTPRRGARFFRRAATFGPAAIVVTAVFVAVSLRGPQSEVSEATPVGRSPSAALNPIPPPIDEPGSAQGAAVVTSNHKTAPASRTAARSEAVLGGPLTAETILRRMAETYASLQWYQDSGEVSAVAPNRRDASLVQFRTAYTRPDLFRVDCFERSTRRPGDPPRQSIAILLNGNRAVANLGYGATSSTVAVDAAIATSISTTRGAGYHIPRLLLPLRYAGFYFTLDRIAEPKLLADEPVETEPCYQLEGRHPNGTSYTLWIAKSDLLIRKIRTVGRLSALSTAQTTAFQAAEAQTLEEIHRNVQTNAEISRTTFDLPALAQ